jgi:hypothetical protein
LWFIASIYDDSSHVGINKNIPDDSSPQLINHYNMYECLSPTMTHRLKK